MSLGGFAVVLGGALLGSNAETFVGGQRVVIAHEQVPTVYRPPQFGVHQARARIAGCLLNRVGRPRVRAAVAAGTVVR